MTLDDYILHPGTRESVDQLLAAPIHGILLTGLKGSGKATLARLVSSGLLGESEISQEAFASHPYVRIVVSEEGKAISIETIRELQHFLSLKIPGKESTTRVNRIVVIEDAHLLTIEAQNALLKTLEEPPKDTVLILTAQTVDAVLPTIQSRIRQLSVRPPARDVVITHFKNRGYTQDTIEKALFISGGLPGLTQALLADDENHPLVLAATHARGILQSKTYQRILMVDGLSKQKELCLDVLYVLGRMSRMALQRATDKASIERWQKVMKASFDAERQLGRSVQAKLVLTNFMLGI